MNFMTYWATKGDWYQKFHKQGVSRYERFRSINPWSEWYDKEKLKNWPVVIAVAALIFSTMGK